MTDSEMIEFIEDNFIGISFGLVCGWVVRSEDGKVMATANEHKGIRVAIEKAVIQLRDNPSEFCRTSYPDSDPIRNP